MLLHTQSLVDTLRSHCDNAKHRIWIASPFIGSSKEVHQILGGTWKRSSIDTRILTDAEAGFVMNDTFNNLTNANVPVRSLRSLHAKIYIVDDWCLITSANLTGTAFSCRYEVGTELDDFIEVEQLFGTWWAMAQPISCLSKPSPAILNYQNGGTSMFSRKCKLPSYSALQGGIDNYLAKCDLYKEFAQIYEDETGRNQAMVNDGFTLLMEVDYMFNFLYHEHPEVPTKGITTVINRTDKKRRSLIRKYYNEMISFYQVDPQLWRIKRTILFSQLLSPSHIDHLTKDELQELCFNFHCMSSYPLNRTRFQNPLNNKLPKIICEWKNLLHTGEITSAKIQDANNNLRFFGPSAIQELIAWVNPETYPMMNANSDSGMRFFGYDV